MIKKIYDRDTGNIYDVGADNKLKLVAEGSCDVESGTSNHSFLINLNNKLEIGKSYIVKIIYDEDECFTSANIFNYYYKTSNGDSNWSLWNLFDYDSDSNILGYMRYEESENYNRLYLTSDDLSGELTLYSNCTCEVYELPFSM